MTTVLVTGATDGLGRVVARDLAELGFAVHVHGRSASRADEVAAEIAKRGWRRYAAYPWATSCATIENASTGR